MASSSEKFGPGPFDDFLVHPEKVIVRFKRADGSEGKALMDVEKFEALLGRVTPEFGASSRDIGGPEIVQPKRKGK